jgi:hypothetical protein
MPANRRILARSTGRREGHAASKCASAAQPLPNESLPRAVLGRRLAGTASPDRQSGGGRSVLHRAQSARLGSQRRECCLSSRARASQPACPDASYAWLSISAARPHVRSGRGRRLRLDEGCCPRAAPAFALTGSGRAGTPRRRIGGHEAGYRVARRCCGRCRRSRAPRERRHVPGPIHLVPSSELG